MAIETINPDAYGRLDVTIQEIEFEAGKISPVTILLRNPFDVPVEVIEILGPRSRHVCEIKKKTKKNKTSPNGESIADESDPQKDDILSTARKLLGAILVTEVSVAGVKAEFLKPKHKEVNIAAKASSTVPIKQDTYNHDALNIKAEEGASITIEYATKDDPEESGASKKSFTIEPHCEAVAYFEISTTSWLFFTPTRQTLSTQITYKIGEKQKTQVSTSEFNVKPPLAAMVTGAITGATLGSIAKILNSNYSIDWQQWTVSIGSSMVMSLIASISLSRKTGSQGFITVEDFFGGFVVGALIGYGGSDYFRKAIIPPDMAKPHIS